MSLGRATPAQLLTAVQVETGYPGEVQSRDCRKGGPAVWPPAARTSGTGDEVINEASK